MKDFLPTWLQPALVLAKVRRTTATPAILRLLAAMTAFGALFASLPTSVAFGRATLQLVPTLGLLALLVGLFPRSRWVGAVAVLCVVEWVLAGVAFGDPASVGRVALIGALLYTMHASAAFAAVLPYDCVVAPGVLTRWALRQGGLLAVGLGTGLALMTVARLVPATPTVAGPVLGAVIAATLAGVLAFLLRRRADRQP